MKYSLVLTVALLAFSVFARADMAASLVGSVQNDEKESLLTDSFGKVLYVFDLDQHLPAPKCTGDCAEVWPPYVVTPAEAGALQAPLGTITRANKKLQLTYLGRPVYTYIFDRQKGDDNGDGIGGVWHYIELK